MCVRLQTQTHDIIYKYLNSWFDFPGKSSVQVFTGMNMIQNKFVHENYDNKINYYLFNKNWAEFQGFLGNRK